MLHYRLPVCHFSVVLVLILCRDLSLILDKSFIWFSSRLISIEGAASGNIRILPQRFTFSGVKIKRQMPLMFSRSFFMGIAIEFHFIQFITEMMILLNVAQSFEKMDMSGIVNCGSRPFAWGTQLWMRKIQLSFWWCPTTATLQKSFFCYTRKQVFQVFIFSYSKRGSNSKSNCLWNST